MIQYFEKVEIKKADDMQPGDIFRCAYGRSKYIVELVFEKCEQLHLKTMVTCHQIGLESQHIFNMNPIERCTFEVVGKEIKEEW